MVDSRGVPLDESAGSVNIPLNHLQERIAEIPRDRRIAVHCAGGYRSYIAASILHQNGITRLIEMAGGLAAWDAARRRVGGSGRVRRST